jgi:CelD/BcsL family acetyltransferase involved in cellulose biosynthesis
VAESRAVAALLLREARERASHVLDLAFLTGSPSEIADWRASLEADGSCALVRVLQRSPYVETGGDHEAYRESLSRSLRAGLRRRSRALEREGHVSMQVLDGAADVDASLDAAIALEGSGWKAARRTAIGSRPQTRRFYGDLARWAASRGLLRLSFLLLGERRIATQFGLETDGAYYFLKGGYDPAFARFSPGRLLHQRMIERSFSLGHESYEFLGGEEPYKLAWAASAREIVALRAFRRTPVGAAWSVRDRYVLPQLRRAARGLGALR